MPTKPPTFAGPEPFRLPPPAASPQPPNPDAGVPPKHDTKGEMRAVIIDNRKAQKRRPWNIAAVATAIVTALAGGGYGAQKAASTADATGVLAVRLDERQKALARDHTDLKAETRDELKEHEDHLRQHDRALERQRRQGDRLELMLNLELDQHQVPKSRRPRRPDGDGDEP